MLVSGCNNCVPDWVSKVTTDTQSRRFESGTVAFRCLTTCIAAINERRAECVGCSRGGKAGLRFREEFDLTCLANAKPEVASNQWLKPSFLDLPLEEDNTPWHVKWGRGSIAEIRDELEGFLKR